MDPGETKDGVVCAGTALEELKVEVELDLELDLDLDLRELLIDSGCL